MMTEAQQREYLDAVDEMRRLQVISRKPPDAHTQKQIKLAEQKVDTLTQKYRPLDIDPLTVAETSAP
jgi:hypothetical protein